MKILIPKKENLGTQNTNYFILIDNSGSIYSSIAALKETVNSVMANMAEKDTISVGRFSGRNSYEWFIRGLNKTANVASLVNTKIYSSGLTHFNKPLEELRDVVLKDVMVISGNTENVFYFLSDGHSNDQSPEDVTLNICSSLNRRFTSKTIVGYGSYYNRRLLLDMADSIGGVFNHISSFQELKESGEALIKNKKSVKVINLPKCFDLIWQVTSNEVIPLSCKDSTVEVLETDEQGELFALDFAELDSLPDDQLNDLKFVASLAYILSQKNRANLAVALLRKAKLFSTAKKLQKSFTVIQKGKEENVLKSLSLKGGAIQAEPVSNTQSIDEFLKGIRDKVGQIQLDMNRSVYRTTSRKGGDKSKVEFKLKDSCAKIIGVEGNENRANINFKTVRIGEIYAINDTELSNKIEEYNSKVQKHEVTGKEIVLPIEAPTFRNYSFVANGDFNFDEITLIDNDKEFQFNPESYIDIFDENVKEIKIKDFASIYTELIKQKAHASVLRMFIKEHAAHKHADDLRVVQYGAEGAKLLEELGLDYAMRYSPKVEYKAKDEDADYIPFTEITAQLKGAAKVSASESYKKFKKGGKQNPGDLICWPLFEEYESKLAKLGKEIFVPLCQKTLDGVEELVDVLSREVSTMKFYLMITNSWFEGVEKSDEFEYDGLVIKVKEDKEYL